ncbi:DNA/RNA non-specific endonuclease [Enterococcus avium]|uniref:DNA/RNA non-specific endonuclease n=1 Tax=Enterococcus avium TaxID=33945 RepID=A0AAW8RU81_ENTAV|nr:MULTISPECIES: DNA/RNA non-specific endonuclease [Enterococcus]MDT2401764.1 DNA/RNA non-specific endonuclease [Enterococcus avium]MDT2434206.1 DNA/RNA non-specific endonuclease [Enterococcus avium]MDT2466104.1 DNA/RNA non-specific endonuclease [Enterococcus avium]MDT2484051.1 DNA/RNA non-specific endonuclease [Enterococcus avium]MDT2505530.1 DNA/RNA non-specific endonuclease [Enterococcus avium]
MRRNKRRSISLIGLLFLLLIGGFRGNYKSVPIQVDKLLNQEKTIKNSQRTEDIPIFDGENYVVTVNKNVPSFTDKDLTIESSGWQKFEDFDSLNRVGVAEAMLHKSMMPTESRGDIQQVYPTGWQQKKIQGKWLYNRSHLIAYQLTGENDNWKNLFTGTEQMNQWPMVKYENKVANYLRATNNHIRYRVNPRFHKNELVCRGVQVEAQSIEDNQLSFNVFIFNIEDEVTIDYATGQASKQ